MFGVVCHYLRPRKRIQCMYLTYEVHSVMHVHVQRIAYMQGPSQFNTSELVGKLTSIVCQLPSSTAYLPPSPPNVGLWACSGEEATAGAATEGGDWNDSPCRC